MESIDGRDCEKLEAMQKKKWQNNDLQVTVKD